MSEVAIALRPSSLFFGGHLPAGLLARVPCCASPAAAWLSVPASCLEVLRNRSVARLDERLRQRHGVLHARPQQPCSAGRCRCRCLRRCLARLGSRREQAPQHRLLRPGPPARFRRSRGRSRGGGRGLCCWWRPCLRQRYSPLHHGIRLLSTQRNLLAPSGSLLIKVAQQSLGRVDRMRPSPGAQAERDVQPERALARRWP